MLKQKMKRLIHKSDPRQKLTLVVFLDSSKELREVSNIKDLHARSRALEQAVWKLKQPLIKAVKRYSDLGLHVVNELEGSPSMVVSGPAHGWQVLMEENQSLATDPRLNIVSNEAIWHTN
nr:hypothetical protein [uncultured Shinella sp.]